MGLFNRNKDENLKNGKKYLKETIGTNLYANHQYFLELENRNVKRRKYWTIWKEVHSQILNELENKNLKAEEVPERCYHLTNKVIENNKDYISDKSVEKTSEKENKKDKLVKKTSENDNLPKKTSKNDKLLKKTSKIENKFNIDLTGKYWFECTIEEIKASTLTNTAKRNLDTCYVIVENTYLDFYKESVVIKTNMGNRRVFYKNISSIDYDAKGKFHLSNSLFINLNSFDSVQLKNIKEKDVEEITKRYENFINNNNQPVKQTTSNADELLKYAELYEKGLLTKEEFDQKKHDLL